jgi:hypothetical protein
MFIFFKILLALFLKSFLFLRDEILLILIFIMKINITFQIIFLIMNQVKITRFLNFNIFYWHVEAGCVWIIIRLIVKVQSYQLITRIYIKVLKWCSLFLSFIVSWVIILDLFYVKHLYFLYIWRFYFCFFLQILIFKWFIKNYVLSLRSVFLSELINIYLFLNVFIYFKLRFRIFIVFLIRWIRLTHVCFLKDFQLFCLELI